MEVFYVSINKNEIIDIFNLFNPDNEEITEVRIFGNRVLSGYYDDPDKLADDIDRYNGNSPIYFTLNKVNSDLINRAYNKLIKAKNTTSDSDIILRKWLLIDLDPIRPSGISSSDEEYEAAQDLAEEIANRLLENEKFPEPVIFSSGNGIHLLYRVELDNTQENTELIKNFLRTLDFHHSTDEVKVDTSAYSASQLTRFYGTVNCKGSNTEERPHRKSELLMIPEEIEKVDIKKLREFTNNAPEIIKYQKASNKKNYSSASTTCNFDLKNWIDKHDLSVAKTGPWEGGTRYILETCPWNKEHTDRSAYIVQLQNGAIAAGCHHDSCSDETWQTLRSKFEPDSTKNILTYGIDDPNDNQIDILKDIIEDIEFFTNELDEPFCILEIDGHKEVWSVSSQRVERFILKEYLSRTGTVPNAENMNRIEKIMGTVADLLTDRSHKVYRRIGSENNNFYYDLVNDSWQSIEITQDGELSILDVSPPIFHRTKNMDSQMIPDFKYADIELIFNHVKLRSEDDKILYLAYLVSSLIPEISHPILVVHGEKGSSKSTFTRMTNSLIDPARQDLLTLPNSKRDLAITLYNNYLSNFDNMDNLSKDKSNLLCQASTGGAFSTRALYTNTEETILELKRCIIMNGINLVISEPDLIDRAIIFELERIGEGNYIEDSVLWDNFKKDKPAILGGMFNALAEARRIYPEVEIDRLSRMADFTKWGYAVIEGMGKNGQKFLNAYFRNKGKSNQEILKSNPLAAAVVTMMRDKVEKKGLFSEMLRDLEKVASRHSINMLSNLWPASASALSRRLKEIKSNLEDAGIKYSRRKKASGKELKFVNENAKNKIKPKKLKIDSEEFFKSDVD